LNKTIESAIDTKIFFFNRPFEVIIMRVIHHVIIATLFLTNLFGVIPNKNSHQEDDLGASSSQLTSSRVVTSHSHFNGNEWYARVVNDGQWATDALAGGSGGLWPRGTNNSVLYDAGLWIGFKDDQDIIQFSGVKHATDFTPGPYGVTDADNDNYRVYKVNRWDDSAVSDWSDWPVNMGAPWEDNNSDGIYDPAVDQPYLPLDQTLYTVYNDSTDHNVFGNSINGIEVHQTIFGGVSSAHNDLSRTFFIKYEIINKGSLNWHNARFGPWSDVDLGDWANDAIGVDIDSNMVYCYSKNAGEETDVFGISPAVGFRYISSVNSLDDTLSSGGCIGNGCGNGVGGDYSDPDNDQHAYNRMLGLDNNGNNIYDPDGQEIQFVHPGDPVSGTGWLDELVGDRQMFFSVAPSQLIEPGDTVGFVMAVIIAQGTDNLNSITELRGASYEAKTLWDSNFNGVGLVDRPILESGEDYGLFSDFIMPSVGPGNTVQLERTYHNGGNEVLNISFDSNTDGYSMDPASVAISAGDHASLTFSFTADNYSTSVHQVPSSYSTIQGALDAAMLTNFNATIELIDDDNYNEQSYVADYSYTGDTILVASGTYTENLHIDNKSLTLIATDGDPALTIIDGNFSGRVIDVENGIGLFNLNGFTIQNGMIPEETTQAGGGITVYGTGSISITNNIFKNNDAGVNSYGGGLYTWYATGTVSRNIFINNIANYGSAVRLNSGGINFYNNTLWHNSLTDWGVVYVRSSAHRIINNIIWDNYGGDFTYIQVNNAPTVEYNIVKNGHDGTGNINDNPLLANTDNGDFRLTELSPAIDAGDPDLDDDGWDWTMDADDRDLNGTRMDIGQRAFLPDSMDNYTLADDWSLVTFFSREEVDEIFPQASANGRTVIGGMDLDRDGLKEIILTDYVGHRVIVFEFINETEGFEQVWSSPIIDNTNHDSTPRTVGVGDLDGDGKEEIVFPVSATGDEGWYIFEWNGVVGSDDYGDTYSSINSLEMDVCCSDDPSAFRGDHERTTIKDIDGDGQQELVIMIRRGSTRGTLITSVTGDIIHNGGGSGSETWSSEGFINSDEYGGGSPYHSLPADLDGDGSYELVNHTWQNFNFYNIDITGTDTYVTATPGSDGSHYQATSEDHVSLFGGTALDIDKDGNEECFFPLYNITGTLDVSGLYLVDYDENDDILQINESHVHSIVDNEKSLLYASAFDIDGDEISNIFTATIDGILSVNYDGTGDITNNMSYETNEIFTINRMTHINISDSLGTVWSDTGYSGYFSKVQSIHNQMPLDFDNDGYKEILVTSPALQETININTYHWNGSDWDTTYHTTHKAINPVVSLLEYQGYQYPNIISSVASISGVHGDTVLVEVELGTFTESLQSVDISFSGFQDKLVFHDIVTDGYMFGNLGWFTQVNNTEELLITASAGANLINGNGVIFALELIIPDTLSTQFVPIVISDFLGNTDITDGTFSEGGVEVVWEPTANFISDTTNGYLPLVISFTDASEIGTYPINQWLWDFGDDSTATGADVEHTYTHEGQYTVTLTVTDEFGLSDTLVMDDYIDALHPIYPVAGFSASVTSGGYPLSVTFTDTSNMGTYEINNWLWDFGNDSTGSGSSVSMSYQRPGEFDVILTITDEYGLSDTLISSSFIDVDTTFGDVDWNTNVQSFDASLILQDLVEIIELDSLQTLIGDVSGDTSLSTLDATLILQYVVGLIDELPYIPDNQYLATGDLTMSDQGADPGMLVEIPINISNGSNIYGFTGTINYDHTILNYDTLLLSDYLDGYLVAFNELSPGEIKIAASGNNPDGETGVFSTLVFYVTNAFTEETSISITNLTWNEGEIIELAAEMSITYGLGIDGIAIPDVYALHQNYPNPFNPTTQIKYDLPEDAMVSITIFDVMGRSIKSLVNIAQSAGYRSIQWDATNNLGEPVSAGMYIYMIQAGEFRQTKKMVLLK